MTQPATVVVRVDDIPALRALDRIAAKFRQVGQQVQAMGRSMMAAGLAGGVPLGISTKVFADTDDALRAVGVIAGATEKEMADLRETAKSFKTFVPADVAAEMLKLAQAGLTAKDAMEAVAATLSLQRIDPELGNQASEIVANVAIPFGKTAAEFEHIADILAIAAARSTTSVGNLGIAMGYAANQGDLAGLSIEQAAAAMAILANNGIDASRAGTNLRGILSVLVAKQKKFAELGVQILDKQGEVRKIEEIFRDLNKAMEGMGGGERLAALTKLFGKIYAGGAAGLLEDAEQFNKLVAEMEGAEGAALKWAEAMDAGAGGAIRSLKKEVFSIAESIGRQLAPSLIAASERFATFSVAAQKWIEMNPAVVHGAAALTAAVTALGAAYVSAGYSIQLVGFGLAGVNKLYAVAIALQKRAVTLHLAEAAAATANATAHAALAAAKIAAATGGVAFLAAAGAVVVLGQAVVGLGTAFAAAKFFPEFAKQSGVMRLVLSGLASGLKFATDAFALLSQKAVAALGKIVSAAKAVLGVVANVFDPRELVRGVAIIARKMVEPFRNAFRALAAALGPMALDAFYTIEAAVRVAFAGAVEVVSDSLSYIAGLFGPLVSAISQAASLAAQPFVAAFRIMGREVAAIVGGTFQFLTGLGSEGMRIAGQLASSFGNLFANVSPAIREITEAMTSGEFQKAFDIAALTAKYAFERAFVDIEIAWLQFVDYFASSFDKGVQSAIGRLRQGAIDMTAALQPVVFAMGLIAGGGKQSAGAAAVAAMKEQANAAVVGLEGAQAEIARSIASADSQLAARLDELKRRGEALDKTFDSAFGEFLKGGDVLGAFAGAGTRFGQSIADTTANAFGPLQDMFTGIGGNLFNDIVAAADEAESVFQSQVFSGASKQVIGQNRDAIGDQQLDVAKEQLKALKNIEEGVEDLEFAWG